MPVVSIVAPVYGVESYIEQFLKSIEEQTFKDFEAILVDDGSPDRCSLILDDFALRESRCKVIHQENAGVSAARNVGLNCACGDYVYVVDPDDWMEPTALETLLNCASKTQADVVYGDFVRESDAYSKRRSCFPRAFCSDNPSTLDALQFAVNSNGNRMKIRRPEFEYIESMGGAPWRGMVRRSVIVENNLRYDPYVRGLGDDILFALHLYEHVECVAYVPEVIYHYRIMEESCSHGYKADYFESLERIFQRQEEFLRECGKGELAWKAYHTRVMIYLQQSLGRYFMNAGNPASDAEQYGEFMQVIRRQPFADAIREAPVELMGSRGMKALTLALRHRLARPYWIAKRFKVEHDARH